MSDIVGRAHDYLAFNAAESGADALIAEMAAEIERLTDQRDRLSAILVNVALALGAELTPELCEHIDWKYGALTGTTSEQNTSSGK